MHPDALAGRCEKGNLKLPMMATGIHVAVFFLLVMSYAFIRIMPLAHFWSNCDLFQTNFLHITFFVELEYISCYVCYTYAYI